MATIDIRNIAEDSIDTITFADDESWRCTSIKKEGGGYIKFDDKEDHVIVAKENIPNLILALQKAIELGWTK